MLGDTVMTGPASTVVLSFLDGSNVLIQENSRLEINQLMLLEHTGMYDVHMRLKSGRLETKVTPQKGTAHRFQITTPATVTSVRGTDYRIASDSTDHSSRTEVEEGQVVVQGADKSRLLPAGFGSVTKKGFEPSPPIELLEAPNVQQLPTVFFQVPIRFDMPISDEIRGYRLQIANHAVFQEVIFDQPYTGTMIRGPDLADDDYYMRIRAIDKHNLEGVNAQYRFTINARPEAPFLAIPKPGAGILLEDELQFKWSRGQDISQYHFQLASDVDFSRLLIDKKNVFSHEFIVNEKQPVGKYFWRVAAIDHDGDGPYSDPQMFRRIIPAPALQAPDITEETLLLRSRKGLPGQKYHFQMAEDVQFSELLLDKLTSEPGFEIPRPNAGEYFVRVRMLDADGFKGPFGAAQSIDVPYSDLYWLLLLLPLFALLAL